MSSRRDPVVAEPVPGHDTLRALVAGGTAPRVTVYLPLQRVGAEVRQNAKLLEQAAREVAQRLSERAAEGGALAEALRAVETDTRRLAPTPAALAVLADDRGVHAFGLPEATPYHVSVAHHYRLRPLLRALRRAARYRVLAVSAKRVALFEGGPERLAPADRPGLPASLEDALGSELTEKQLRVRGTRSAGAAPAFYAHRSGKDERKLDLARFHEALARALDATLPADGVPLVLAGTEEHQGGLRAAACRADLLDGGVPGNPDLLGPQELHERAWPVVQRWLAGRPEVSGARWERARNLGKGLDLLDDIGAAALAGRIRCLWVDATRSLPGCIDGQTGRVVEGPEGDDALDALVEHVLARGGEVVPLDAASVPSPAGAAAELH